MKKTVMACMESTKTKYFDKKALTWKDQGSWVSLTWGQYYEKVYTFAKGLISLGLDEDSFVTILSQNRYEWVVADLGVIAAKSVPTGIYPTSSTSQCQYILSHCKASVCIVENYKQLEKIEAVWSALPNLKFVVLLEGKSQSKRVYTWDEVLLAGEKMENSILKKRIEAQNPEDLATLVYTSGTTANPKAVMLSHENLTWTAWVLATGAFNMAENDRTISYLPLSHIAEQMTTIHGPLVVGAMVSFVESFDKLAENLKEVRPTLFLGVPRVWEKIQQKMLEKALRNNALKKMIARWARRIATKNRRNIEEGKPKSFLFSLADKLVYSKVKKALGLDCCKLQVTAAAPISNDTVEFFLSLNIPLYEIYGMSESSGPATISYPGQFRLAKAGVVMPGGEVKIADDGEILIRGQHVFKGYLDNEEETKKILDEDGWLHSGDIGEFDQEGFLSITGRKKNILITAGGENVAPEMLENKINSIAGIEQAVVIGDQKKYLTALVTLSEDAVVLSKNFGCDAKNLEELSCCPKFKKYLLKEFGILNRTVARVQTIKKFEILSNSFSEDKGELTPTLKIKRNVICQNYADDIARMYS